MGDEYRPFDSSGGNIGNGGDQYQHFFIFDTGSISLEHRIERGIIRPIKYLVIPELTFIVDRSWKKQLPTDDGKKWQQWQARG
jgi:hypothetical protein